MAHSNRTSLSVERQEELWWRAIADREAMDELVENYLYVAKREARKYEPYSDLDYDDLYSEACCYVVEAINKWRPGCCHRYISGMVVNHVAVKMRQFVENSRVEEEPLDDFEFIFSEDSFDEVEDRMIVESMLKVAKLTDRERLILSMYYGLYNGSPMTLTEIGNYYGVTKDRIAQIRNRAILKCRHPRVWSVGRLRYIPNYIPLPSLENIC